MTPDPVGDRLMETVGILLLASMIALPVAVNAPKWGRWLGYTLVGLAWFGLFLAIVAHIWGLL